MVFLNLFAVRTLCGLGCNKHAFVLLNSGLFKVSNKYEDLRLAALKRSKEFLVRMTLLKCEKCNLLVCLEKTSDTRRLSLV